MGETFWNQSARTRMQLEHGVYVSPNAAGSLQPCRRPAESCVCTSFVPIGLYGYTCRPPTCVGWWRYEKSIHPAAPVPHPSYGGESTRLVYPDVSTSRIAVCRSGLSPQEWFARKCDYLPPPQNRPFLVRDADTGSNVLVAKTHEPQLWIALSLSHPAKQRGNGRSISWISAGIAQL